MLAVALILAVVGLLALMAPIPASSPDAARAVRFIGWALVLAAVAVLVLWIADDADLDVDERRGALLTFAAAGMVGGPRLGSEPRARPVLGAFAIAAVPVVAAFALLVLGEAGVLESAPWIKAALTGAGALAGGLGAAWAQARVTPVADPRDDEGHALLATIPGQNRTIEGEDR
jgi:hypothetical protein